jgi:hypothetical protein
MRNFAAGNKGTKGRRHECRDARLFINNKFLQVNAMESKHISPLRFGYPITGKESAFGGLIVSFCIAAYFRITGEYAKKHFAHAENYI